MNTPMITNIRNLNKQTVSRFGNFTIKTVSSESLQTNKNPNRGNIKDITWNVDFSSREKIACRKENLFSGYIESPISPRKRATDSIEDNIANSKRQRIVQKTSHITTRNSLPADLWFYTLSFLSFQDCGNLSFVSKAFSTLVFETFFPSVSQITTLRTEYYKFLSITDNVKAESVLQLIDRTVVFISAGEFKDSIPSTLVIKEEERESFREMIEAYSYNDQNDFLLNLFLGNERYVHLSHLERTKFINLADSLCDYNAFPGNDYKLYHANKIIQYFVQWEDTATMRRQAINTLFKGIENAISNGNKKEIKVWVELLEKSSFYLINESEKKIWKKKLEALAINPPCHISKWQKDALTKIWHLVTKSWPLN